MSENKGRIFIYSTSLVLGALLVLQAWATGRQTELNWAVPMTIIGAALISLSERMATAKNLAPILLVIGIFAVLILGIPLFFIFLGTIAVVSGDSTNTVYNRSTLLLGAVVAAYVLAVLWSTWRLKHRSRRSG